MKHAVTETHRYAERCFELRRLRGLAGLLACYGLAGFAWWNTLGCGVPPRLAGVVTTFATNVGSVEMRCSGEVLRCPLPGDLDTSGGSSYSVCLTPSSPGFSSWSESCGCSSGSIFTNFNCDDPNQCRIRVAPDTTTECVANFCEAFELSVDLIGTGTVESSPAGIDCPRGNCRSSFCDIAGPGIIPTITLQARARTGSGDAFAGWEGDPDCADGVVSMNGAKNCVARFRPPVLSVSATGAGRVTGLPGLACRESSPPAACEGSAPVNSFVRLTADPDLGAQFIAWGGDCPDGADSTSFFFNGDQSCTATFSAIGAGGNGGIEILSRADDESLADFQVDIAESELSGSADLAFVAFRSQATNLTAAPEPSWCAYVRGREAGTTRRITGPTLLLPSAFSLSADGSFAAYEDAIPDPIFGFVIRAYRRDLRSNAEELISVDFPVPQDGAFPAISGNGRFVAYRAQVEAARQGIVVRDTCSGALPALACTPHTVVVSSDPGGVLLGSLEGAPRISRDGRFVLFRGYRQTGQGPELYLHDRDSDSDGLFDEPGFATTIFAAPDPVGGVLELDLSEIRHDLDASGRYVAFQSPDPDLPNTGGSTAPGRSFLRDTCAGAPAGCVPSYAILSVRQDGTPVDNTEQVLFSDLSGSGRFAMFYTTDALMVGSDDSAFLNRAQIVLRDTCVGAPAGCTPGNRLVSRQGNGSPLPGNHYMPRVSDDGGAAVFFGIRQAVVASPNSFYDEVLFAPTGIVPDPGLLPAISGRTPSSGPAGSPELIITLSGSNFVPGVGVLWNGASRPAIFISPRKLQLRLSQADLATAGVATVRVANPGGLTSNQVSFVVN